MPARTKVLISWKILEPVFHFSYLGSDVSFKFDKDIGKKVNRFQKICGKIAGTVGRKTRKGTLLKIYKLIDVINDSE